MPKRLHQTEKVATPKRKKIYLRGRSILVAAQSFTYLAELNFGESNTPDLLYQRFLAVDRNCQRLFSCSQQCLISVHRESRAIIVDIVPLLIVNNRLSRVNTCQVHLERRTLLQNRTSITKGRYRLPKGACHTSKRWREVSCHRTIQRLRHRAPCHPVAKIDSPPLIP